MSMEPYTRSRHAVCALLHSVLSVTPLPRRSTMLPAGSRRISNAGPRMWWPRRRRLWAPPLPPPLLVLTAAHDDRVAPAHSYRVVATMKSEAPENAGYLGVETCGG